MTIKQVDDLRTPIGEVLQEATRDGLVLESGGQPRFALLPLDDELLDYLVEHSPRFMEVCEGIASECRRAVSIRTKRSRRLSG